MHAGLSVTVTEVVSSAVHETALTQNEPPVAPVGRTEQGLNIPMSSEMVPPALVLVLI